jgi:LysM repeat protein
VNPAADEITCDLTVDPSLAPVPSPRVKTYTVATGDSLSKIAKNFYGNAGQLHEGLRGQ